MKFLFVLIFLVFLYYAENPPLNNTAQNSYKAGDLLALGDKPAQEKLDEIEIIDPSINLKPCEACLYEGIGYVLEAKEVVTGYNRTSYGTSFKTIFGNYRHNSTSKTDIIRKTVKNTFNGQLFITNSRIVFLAEKYSFDSSFDKITNITVYNDRIELYSRNKFYKVFTKDSAYIRDLITLMNICYNEQQISAPI